MIESIIIRVVTKTAQAFTGAVHKEVSAFNKMNQPRKQSRPTTRKTPYRKTTRR
jgi:hypothetical protein